MASSAGQQLMNGDEDPYTSEGHIELKIENLTLVGRQKSESVYVRGMPWKINVDHKTGRPERKCLLCLLLCDGGTDPFWSYLVTAQFKVLAQKEGCVDQVLEVRQIFHAEKVYCSPLFHDRMTLEYLMNPDNGLYDEQTDSLMLAVDFTATLPEGVSEYVVVAQNELELELPNRSSLQIGNLGWEINFDAVDQEDKNGEKSLVLSCKDVAKGRVDKVLLELFSYRHDEYKYNNNYQDSQYQNFLEKHHHLFTAKDNKLIAGRYNLISNIILTVRLLKERSQFPDFTEPTAMVGHNAANVKLRVGDKQFHVNKQFLSSLSQFFNRMFNGLFDAATQPEVELGLNMHSAELFHHFLLVMFVNEALPNSMNVAALFKLAHYYNAENVRVKCAQHIRMAREMPIEKRLLLARDYCSKGTQDLIVDSAHFEESPRITLLLMQNCSIYYEAEI